MNSPREETPRPRIRDRLDDLEREMRVIIAHNDALRALLIGLIASLSTAVRQWPAHLQKMSAFTAAIIADLEFGEEEAEAERLPP